MPISHSFLDAKNQILEVYNVRNRAFFKHICFKVAQLAKDFPFMNWTIFFQSAFNAINDTFSINQDTEILIQV